MKAADNLTIVVGAGIAGLSCARTLADAGRPVVVLDRARGVGGRCATRRLEEQPIDFGVLFLHGRDPGFLAALDEVPAERAPGWPQVIQGVGRPCQPEAFAPGERRVAFVEGVSAFPKHLARGLDVRLRARVISFDLEGAALRLDLEEAEPLRAPTVVLALAAEQTLALLTSSPAAAPALATARALLGMVRSQACLTVTAGYSLDTPAPPFHLHYPEASRVLQVISHESSKRPGAAYRAMVYQAHPRWSREHQNDPEHAPAMIAEAASLLGAWAGEPRFVRAHRWRYARTDRGAEMSGAPLLRLPGGARLGLAGELFAPGGGVEAAWLSGRSLARHILASEER
jgi:hypothetical protein